MIAQIVIKPMIRFAFGVLVGLYTSNGYYKQNKYMANTIAEYQKTVGIYKKFIQSNNLNSCFDNYISSLGTDVTRQLLSSKL